MRPFIRRPTSLGAAVVVAPVQDAVRKPAFPFVRIQGQELMKLAICLNVVDPAIGGVLIMGDRGTGKSVTVRNGSYPDLISMRTDPYIYPSVAPSGSGHARPATLHQRC